MGRKAGVCFSTVGLAVASVAAWYLMKGPFLGTGLPPVENVMVAVAGFLVGLLVLRSGLNAMIHHGDDSERVVISNKKV